MIDAAMGLAAGFALGGLYFGGLWLTLNRAESSRHPGLLLTGSYVLRLAVAALGFGLLAVRGILPAAAGLAGFLLARTLLVHRLRPRADVREGRGSGASPGARRAAGPGKGG